MYIKLYLVDVTTLFWNKNRQELHKLKVMSYENDTI